MRTLKVTTLACAVLLASGCTMAPKYERPEAPVAQTFPSGDAYVDIEKTTAPLPLWEDFITNPKARQVVRLALEK